MEGGGERDDGSREEEEARAAGGVGAAVLGRLGATVSGAPSQRTGRWQDTHSRARHVSCSVVTCGQVGMRAPALRGLAVRDDSPPDRSDGLSAELRTKASRHGSDTHPHFLT